MTRDEFIEKCDLLSSETKYSSKPWHIWLAEMASNDAEQRATIEQLEEKVKAYEGGCPHDSLGDQARTIEQQAQEIARLREALRTLTTGECGSFLATRFPSTLQQAQQALKESST